MPQKRALILVPTYNEIENISRFLQTLLQTEGYDILVMDDSSPDGTAKAVEEIQKKSPRVHLLNRKKKEGLALAYLAGFEWGMEKGYDQFVQMDADFSHSPKDLPRLLKALETSDMAMGSRYIPGGSVSGWGPIRQLISRGGNIYAQSILGLKYRDLTGGFNAWNRHALEKMDLRAIRSKGYAYQVEMKYRCIKAGCTLKEIPIHFENRILGTSKMSSDIIWEAAGRVVKLRFPPKK